MSNALCHYFSQQIFKRPNFLYKKEIKKFISDDPLHYIDCESFNKTIEFVFCWMNHSYK